MRNSSHKGSALIMALWTIAVLSIMVLAFSLEARLQSGVNFYVRERNRVDRLVESGKILAEVVLSSYKDVTDWSEDEDTQKILDEDDRWLMEKRALKKESKCKIGPILLDDSKDDTGAYKNPSTVTVEISVDGGGSEKSININELYEGCGDANYRLRLEMILYSHGIDPELEVKDDEGRSVVLANWLIACWNDWRDEDNSQGKVEEAQGAEEDWYEKDDEDKRVAEEDRIKPRNGSIPSVEELARIRGFRMYPSVLTGGLLYPEENESEDNPRVRGIVNIFGVTGGTKINPNTCGVDELLTVPGICDVEDLEESKIIAEAIIAARAEMPENQTGIDENRTWWPFKDFEDLCYRVNENIGDEARNYLVFATEENSVFRIKITCESLGMTRVVNAKGYVKDKKIRYIEWRED
ncbi:MAG: hypothetical protein J6S51_04160 [Kiritimatiellae bacterium]|nr:hypothetical protein [Kiritimatiellia bacterium]